MSDTISCSECGAETEWWHELEHLSDCSMPEQIAAERDRRTGGSGS